ncbi:DUF7432 family protein [Microbacterium sp. MMO-56]|uniref:DUF7432 family protein n=1 Tax=Microbacterium sp. MMO-56 TaxID=3081281 RepID=UPI003016B0C6
MARPEAVEELHEHERKAHEFVRADPQFITADIAVGAALLTLIDVARRSPVFTVDEDGQFLITVPLTPAELDSRLRSAQRIWEYNRDDYAKAAGDVTAVEQWRRTAIDYWAKGEGLDPIAWDATELGAVL